MKRVSSVSRTRGPLYCVSVLWHRKHWSLAPAAEDYAARHGATAAQADIDWIDAEAARLPADEVVAYMSANRKGEYRP